jgi:hypothetical protein
VLKSGDYVWPHIVFIEFPQDPSVRIEQPANWDTIDRSLFRYAFLGAQSELEKFVRQTVRSRAAVQATIRGRLDARFDEIHPDMLALSGNSPYGYGHNNLVPARIVVVAVKDITVAVDGKSLQEWEASGGIPKR